VPEVDQVNVAMLYNRSLLKLQLNGIGTPMEVDGDPVDCIDRTGRRQLDD
jgi:hypothetical protein